MLKYSLCLNSYMAKVGRPPGTYNYDGKRDILPFISDTPKTPQQIAREMRRASIVYSRIHPMTVRNRLRDLARAGLVEEVYRIQTGSRIQMWRRRLG